MIIKGGLLNYVIAGSVGGVGRPSIRKLFNLPFIVVKVTVAKV